MESGVSVATEEFDIQVPSGRIHAKRYGERGGHLVLALPGLSVSHVGFDYICERVVGPGREVVAVDLRGRGQSDATGPGSYGWVSHAKDAFAIADALGAERFTILGQSMGGSVAMTAASMDASRIAGIVLIDICGVTDDGALQLILAGVARLGTVYPSVEMYLETVRNLGTVTPWSDYWERFFRSELVPVEGGVAARSNRDAVLQDYCFGTGAMTMGDDSGIYGLWKHLTMPVLLLYGTVELMTGFGRIVTDRDRKRFPREVPTARVVDVEANHYGINTHPDSAAAIREFLTSGV